MKKIITLSLVAVSLAATSSFAQGYFQFTSSKSQAYDGFTTAGVSTLAATVNTSFLWAPASTVPHIASLLASTPKTGNSTTQEAYSVATAWSTILDGQFNVATNSGTGAVVTYTTSSTGVINYNSGNSFGVANTSSSTTYTIYEISWPSTYATPAAAQTAGAAVGWSTPLQYAAVNNLGTAQTMVGSFASFGTFVPAPVPEPATMALAAIGGASLLLFRRRK